MPDLSTPLDFLLTRRSTPARSLTEPAPAGADLRRLLTAAARVPDHGKLVPWRFFVLDAAARARMAALTREIGAAQGRDPDKLTKLADGFAASPAIVAVASTPDPEAAIPVLEQRMTAGAVCLSLLNAAMAAGYAGNWLTGWVAQDPDFLDRGFGLAAPACIAGFVHLGTAPAPAPERPRPDLDAITTWVHE